MTERGKKCETGLRPGISIGTWRTSVLESLLFSFEMIAPQREWSVEDPIHPEDLNLEAIAGLSKHKKSYIAFAFQQNMLTHAAQNTIKEHLSFCLDDEDEGTESLSSLVSRRSDCFSCAKHCCV